MRSPRAFALAVPALSACLVLGVAGLASGAGGGQAERAPRAPDRLERGAGPAGFVPGELVVRFRPGVGSAEQAASVRARGARVERALRLGRTKVVKLPAGASVEAAARALERDPDVLYAEPNYVYRVAAVTPDDPQYDQLWGLAKIGAPDAWAFTTGSAAVKVAVIDTGVASDHPDLAGNMIAGYDHVDDDAEPLDFHGHGTHVAGTIGAVGDNTLGVTGVNWTVSLMPLRAGDAYGSFTSAAIVDAFTYACANGARVVNGSFGGGGYAAAQEDAINSPACADTLFVFAAGNGGADGVGDDNDLTPTYPCSYPSARIVCVAATSSIDTLASFSNYGATRVDLAAPGVGIRSSVVGWEQQTGFFPETFEDGTAFTSRWGGKTGAGAWDRTSARASSGSFSLADSPAGNYGADADESIRNLVPLDFTGKDGCQLDYALWLQAEAGWDGLWIETATATTGPWTATDVLSHNVGSFLGITSDVSTLDGSASGYLRFRFTSDGINQLDGAFVDDVSAWCLDAGGEVYDSFNGTSMAAPHVAGVAALVLAEDPTLTTAELKDVLLTTVEPVAGLAGKLVTGGRVDAAAAVTSVVAGLPAAPVIESGPSGFVGSTDATFALTAEPDATFECRLDGEEFAACSSPVEHAGLADGAHTFEARAVNGIGPSVAASRTWTVDTVAPAAPVLAQTWKTLSALTVSWDASTDPAAPVSYDVFVNGVKVATKAGTKHAISGLPCGAMRTIAVEVVDKAGNRSARSWMVARTKPCRCVVPRLRGKTLRGAKAALVKRHCRIGNVRRAYSAYVRKGRVMKQSRRAGTKHARGTKVGVVLSRGRRW